jgi:hypothetical protein
MYKQFTEVEIEQLKQLLNMGVKPQTIMFEFDISKEQIETLIHNDEKREIDVPYSKNRIESEQYISRKNNESDRRAKEAHEKMEAMRSRYRKLCHDFEESKNDQNIVKKVTPEAEESKKINEAISGIEELIAKLPEKSKEDRRNIASKIIDLSKNININECTFTLPQISKLTKLAYDKNLENIHSVSKRKKTFYNNIYVSDPKDEIGLEIESFREQTIRKLSKTVLEELSKIDNLEDLQKIKSQLPTRIQNNFLYNNLNSSVCYKELELKTKCAKEKTMYDISHPIKALVQDIANGTVNIEEANKIIDENAEQRMNQTQKGFVKNTIERQRKQVMIQIRSLLMDNPEEFKIQNSEESFKILQQLFPNEEQQNLRTVVKSLSNNGNFSEAKSLCNKVLKMQDFESDFKKFIRNSLKKDVARDEIASLVLRGLNASSTPEEEANFLEVLEQGLDKSFIKPGSVIIARSQSGKRQITLESILPDELQK